MNDRKPDRLRGGARKRRLVWTALSVLVICVLTLVGSINPAVAQGDTDDPLSPALELPEGVVLIQVPFGAGFRAAGLHAVTIPEIEAEAEISVQVRYSHFQEDPIDAVLAGRAPFGLAPGAEVLERRLAGEPLVSVLPIMQSSSWALAVRADSEIYSPLDLYGKKVALDPEHQAVEMDAFLRAEGIKPGDILYEPWRGDFSTLASGEVDATVVSLVGDLRNLDSQGFPYRVIVPRDFGIDFYGDIIFTTESVHKSNRSQVAALRKALMLGWNSALTNSERIITRLAGAEGEALHEAMHYEALAVAALIQTDVVEFGHQSESRWLRMGTFISGEPATAIKPRLEGFVYSEFDESGRMWIARVLYLIGIIVIIGASFTLWNLALQRRVREELSRRQALESQLAQAEKLNALGRLAGGIAHDFNNILMAIMGNAYLLKHEAQKSHTDQSGVNEIMNAVERGAGLTNQLLSFSRERPAEPRYVRVDDAIRSLEKLLRRLLRENVELVCELGSTTTNIYIDPVQLDQIIMNLAINAGDAMPRGGTLTIRSNPCPGPAAKTRAGGQEQRWVCIEISDTGVGMAPETAERIFEPFFTTKAEGKGTGLGLSVVYGNVQTAGGLIEVRSKPGSGTRFLVYFPQSLQQIRPVSVGRQLHNIFEPGHQVLLVEDEDGTRKTLVSALESWDLQVIQAANGAEALSAVRGREEQISLVITDLVMPQIGGVELARQLRDIEPSLSFIFISGHLDEALGDPRDVIADAGFLRKPFRLEQLNRAIANWVPVAGQAETSSEEQSA